MHLGGHLKYKFLAAVLMSNCLAKDAKSFYYAVCYWIIKILHFYLLQLHLHTGGQSRSALPHVQFEQSPLQVHFNNSLHDLETSGIVIHTGAHESSTLLQPKSCAEGTTCCVCVLVVQIPAWYTARRVCWRKASFVGGSLSIARFLWRKRSLRVSFT